MSRATAISLAAAFDGGGGGTSRRWSAPSQIGLGFVGRVCGGTVNLVVRAAPAPTSIYVALATGAHQPIGLGAPDQGAVKGWHLAVGPNA